VWLPIDVLTQRAQSTSVRLPQPTTYRTLAGPSPSYPGRSVYLERKTISPNACRKLSCYVWQYPREANTNEQRMAAQVRNVAETIPNGHTSTWACRYFAAHCMQEWCHGEVAIFHSSSMVSGKREKGNPRGDSRVASAPPQPGEYIRVPLWPICGHSHQVAMEILG
jgi:hypothetical protein